MKLIRLNLRGKSPLTKVAFAQSVATGLTANPNFPTPDVTPASITAAATALQTAQAKVTEAALLQQQRVAERDVAEATLNDVLEQAAEYVEETAAGDTAKILSANFELRADGAPIGPLPAPTSLSISAGDEEGEMDAQWDSMRGAQFFEFQLKEEGTTDWITRATDTKSKVSVQGLTSGKKYRGRVRAKGAAGYGPWSDETTARTAP